MSTLCKRCRVIQFDDANLNGTVETSASGDSYFAPHLEGEEFTHCHWLDYDLKDVLPDLPVLSQSAENGCSLCLLLKTEIAKFLVDLIPTYADLFIHKLCYAMIPHNLCEEPPFRPHLTSLCVCLRLLNESSGEEDASWVLQLGIQAHPADPCAQWLSIPRRAVQQDVLSEAGVRRLNDLMEIAVQIPLAPVTKDRSLPTRLIDTGFRGEGEGNDEPRLVITADYPPLQRLCGDQRYVALSYCWGPLEKAKRQLTTKTSTLRDRLCQIPFSTFPKTHQDAIQICNLLGVRYIWIDSLCIVQDDKVDWEREAEQMGRVYANAYLTICAGQGSSCLDGFLTRKVPSSTVEVRFSSSLNPSVSGFFSIFAPPGDVAPISPLKFGQEFDDFDLGSMGLYFPYLFDQDCSWKQRGWTFQEALLSPRSLFFGDRMVHVCSGDDLIYSEDAIYDISPEEVQEKSNGLLRNMQEEHLRKSGDGSMFSRWRGLISSYSSRSLTYQSDIFPALSALAKIWTERVGGDYMAGIFTSELSNALLWSTEVRQPAAKYLGTFTEEAYTAPSWSWASQPRSITWVSHTKSTYKPEFQLLDIHVTLDGLNSYGRVNDAYLLLSTKICAIPSTSIRRNGQWWGFVFPYELLADDGTVLAHIRPDWLLSDELSEEVEDRYGGPVDQLSMILLSSKFTDADWRDGLYRDDISYQDLLLGVLALPTGNPGEYRRAGVFFTSANGPCGREFWDTWSTQKVRLI